MEEKASLWAEKMGIPVQMKDGRRITDAATLELISGIYAGQVNKTIVAHLQAFGCNALGLSGADGNAIRADKRPVKAIDYGFVGDVREVNVNLYQQLLEVACAGVLCPHPRRQRATVEHQCRHHYSRNWKGPSETVCNQNQLLF